MPIKAGKCPAGGETLVPKGERSQRAETACCRIRNETVPVTELPDYQIILKPVDEKTVHYKWEWPPWGPPHPWCHTLSPG